MTDYTYIIDYIPTTDSRATEKQVKDRNAVLDFLDGDLSQNLKKSILEKVKSLALGSKNVCILGFIPSWTAEKTMDRYGKLASFLSANLDIEVFPDVLTLKQDSDPILLHKEYVCNISRVKGNDVILIGGVTNTGRTFEKVSKLLEQNGASAVYGLFVAKVHTDTTSKRI